MNRLRFIENAPLHTMLFAAYPVLHIAASNPGQAPDASVTLVASTAIVAAAAVLSAARLFAGSWARAGLVAATLVVIIFAFGPIHASLENALLDAVDRRQDTVLRPDRLGFAMSIGALLAFCACALAIARLPQHRVVRMTGALNVTSLALITYVAGQLLVLPRQAVFSIEGRMAPASQAQASEEARDIYYIVLDGYARQDILREYYGHDNREFVEGLRARGFTVSDASTSNYFWTFLSLASALNFRYIEDLAPQPFDRKSTKQSVLYETIRNSAVSQFLGRHGYEIVHVQSTWGATRDNPHADVQVRCAGRVFGDEFRRAVWDATWLRIFNARASADLARCHASNFESLKALGQRTGPKFVFAHFLLPHHPYVFDRHGRVLHEADLSSQFETQKRLWEDRNAYIEQLLYVNRRVLEVCDAIEAGSSRPPIILIQSDHGPNLSETVSRPERMRIRFANFSAHRLPGAPTELIPRDDSAVNLFPRVFNHYFGTRHAILPNRHFYSRFRTPLAIREMQPRELMLSATPRSGQAEVELPRDLQPDVN